MYRQKDYYVRHYFDTYTHTHTHTNEIIIINETAERYEKLPLYSSCEYTRR